MEERRLLAGVDLGTSAVRIVIADTQPEEETLNVTGVGEAPSRGIRDGAVVNMEKGVAAIRQAANQAQTVAGVDLDEAHLTVGITGKQIYSKSSNGMVAIKDDRPVTKLEMNRVLDQSRATTIPAGHEIIYTHANGFTVDTTGGIKNPVGLTGIRLEVESYIVTADRNFLRNVSTCLSHAGLRVDEFFFNPIAASLAVMDEEDFEEGAVLLDIGKSTTDLALWHDEMLLHLNVMGLGGDYVTDTVARELLISRTAAAYLLKNHGAASPHWIDNGSDMVSFTDPKRGTEYRVDRKRLAGVIETGLGELFSRYRQELERTGYYRQLVSGTGMVLVGGLALLAGIREMAEEVFHLPVVIGRAGGITGFMENAHSPRFSVAIGLIKRGAKVTAKPRKIRKMSIGGGALKSLVKNISELF